MSPLRRACYAWLALPWTRRLECCRALELPLPMAEEGDIEWGRRVMQATKDRALEARVEALARELDPDRDVSGDRLRSDAIHS